MQKQNALAEELFLNYFTQEKYIGDRWGAHTCVPIERGGYASLVALGRKMRCDSKALFIWFANPYIATNSCEKKGVNEK